MSPKKQYKKQLPAILPPSQRRAPEAETSAPEKAPTAPPSESPSESAAQSFSAPRVEQRPGPRPQSRLVSHPGPRPQLGTASRPESRLASSTGPRPQPRVASSTGPRPQSQVASRPEPRPASPPTPAVLQPADEPDHRPRLAVVALGVALAVLVGALTAGVVLWRTGGGDPDRAPTASAPEQGWPAAGASRTVTEVLPSGDLEVTHWIHTTDPISDLSLSLPEIPQAEAIQVSAVRVVADDERASGPATIGFGSGSYVFTDATRILVRYQMSGAVERSSSAEGRGLAILTALEVSAPPERDTRVIRSQAVLSLACAGSADAAASPCGTPDSDDQWRVDLTGDEVGDRVLATVTVS